MLKRAAIENQRKSSLGGKRAGAGRPRGAVNKATADVRLLARSHGPAAIAELVRLSTKACSEGVRVAAIKELLDRGYGKSPQPLTGDGGEGAIIVEIVRFGGEASHE
jgi:hypothetical protein